MFKLGCIKTGVLCWNWSSRLSRSLLQVITLSLLPLLFSTNILSPIRKIKPPPFSMQLAKRDGVRWHWFWLPWCSSLGSYGVCDFCRGDQLASQWSFHFIPSLVVVLLVNVSHRQYWSRTGVPWSGSDGAWLPPFFFGRVSSSPAKAMIFFL